MSNVALNRWKKGDKFSASHLNEAVDVVRGLTHVDGNGLSIVRTPTGTAIIVQSETLVQTFYLCAVSLAPGGGLVDFTDERYWLKFKYVNDADSHAQIVLKDDIPAQDTFGTTPSNYYTQEYPFVGTNLGELLTHTHSLADGTPGLAFKVLDHQSGTTYGPVHHWLFMPGGGGGLSTFGQYQGQVLQMIAQRQTGWDFVMGSPLI